MKRGDEKALGWVYVKHGLLREEELLHIVETFCGAAESDENIRLDNEYASRWKTDQNRGVDSGLYEVGFQGEVGGPLYEHLQGRSTTNSAPFPLPTTGTISLKMEPYVMHVECRTMESAKTLLTAAVTDGGYRNSGVTPPGKKIMCGIRCTSGLGLEVPLVLRGENFVKTQRKYLWELLHLANCKMLDNEKRTLRLEKGLKHRLGQV